MLAGTDTDGSELASATTTPPEVAAELILTLFPVSVFPPPMLAAASGTDTGTIGFTVKLPVLVTPA